MRPLGFHTLLIFITILSAAGCAHPQKAAESSPAPMAVDETDIPQEALSDPANGDSDSGKALGLHSIHFAYRLSALTDEEEALLLENVQILRTRPAVRIEIEGHGDQRGTTMRNMEIGEQRAKAVAAFLKKHGISPDRMSVISYGHERPIDRAETEEAWAKNRRANFVITSR
ncbi:MAG: OmpA family protein [Bdellovibrionota bacterium]